MGSCPPKPQRTRMPFLEAIAACVAVGALLAAPVSAQTTDHIRRDTGDGIPVSMFGTYIEEGELLIYPFFEYYRDSDTPPWAHAVLLSFGSPLASSMTR